MELYKALPRQLEFHKATADETLYGGSAGGGKSYAILWDAVGFCLEHKKVRCAIFRRTYPELEKSIIFEFLRVVPETWYKYSKQEHRVVFTKTDSVLEFNHCQYETDVYRFQSAQYDRLYFDELTHFTEFIYKYLLSRLRTVKIGLQTQVKSASNPGGIGHNWVKERFIDGMEPGINCNRTDENSGSKYTTIFIPAKIFDNSYLMDANPEYIGNLSRLPEDERKMLLDGDWNAFKGQFFKEWRTKFHVIEPFSIPKNWKRFRALDWGYRNPTAVLWIAVTPDKRIIVYRELYITEMTDIELCREIINLSEGENISYTVADPSLWSVTQYERGESIALRMSNLGVQMIRADNSRISGWNAVRAFLRVDDRDSRPTLQFFSTCYNCIKTIPSLIHDNKNPDDVDTEGDDHAADALRYGIMSNPVPRPDSPKRVNPNTFDWYIKKRRQQRDAGAYIGKL